MELHRRKRLVPFIEAAGGFLWSTVNIPPGDTSRINFTPGGGGGMHIFLKPDRAITWTLRAVHISNASLGSHNPGVNASSRPASAIRGSKCGNVARQADEQLSRCHVERNKR